MMAEEQARLTIAGKLISILLVLGLIGTGIYVVSRRGIGGGGSSTGGSASEAPQTEAPDTKGVTTVSEYKYVPVDKLPPVNAENHGTKPNADSVFSKKYGFKVEMVLMDDPVVARDAFAAGEVHTLWGTVDMMTLFAPELTRDSRTSPRIFQQIDWSSGGDAIVVRNNIKSVADLKGKTITLAGNSPSEYYLTSLLLSAGM